MQDGSKVSHFAQGTPGFQYDAEKPYAEVRELEGARGKAGALTRARPQLWMGTHPSCPSRLASSNESLKEYLVKHPELLGAKVVQKFGQDLPFLFKVRKLRGTA